jgi:hypothetical protein
MLALIRDEKLDIAFRADMAIHAAPYVHQKLVATDNMNRRPPPRTDQSIEQLRDELLQDMVEAGLVTLLPDPELSLRRPLSLRQPGLRTGKTGRSISPRARVQRRVITANILRPIGSKLSGYGKASALDTLRASSIYSDGVYHSTWPVPAPSSLP